MALRRSLLASLAVFILAAIQGAHSQDDPGDYEVLVLLPLDIMNHQKDEDIKYREVALHNGYFRTFGGMYYGSFSNVTDGDYLIWGEERKYATAVHVIKREDDVYVRITVVANAYDTRSIYKKKFEDEYITITPECFLSAYKRALRPSVIGFDDFLPATHHSVDEEGYYVELWLPPEHDYVTGLEYGGETFWTLDDASGDLLNYAMVYRAADAAEIYYALVIETSRGILYAKHYKLVQGKPVAVDVPLPLFKKIEQPYRYQRAIFETKKPFYPGDAKAIALHYSQDEVRKYLLESNLPANLEKIQFVFVPELYSKVVKVVLEGKTVDLQKNCVYNVYSTGINDGSLTHFDAYYEGRKTRVFAFDQSPSNAFSLSYYGFHTQVRTISKVIPTADLSRPTRGIDRNAKRTWDGSYITLTVQNGYIFDALTFNGVSVWPNEKLAGKVFLSLVLQLTKGEPKASIEYLDENGIAATVPFNMLPLHEIAAFIKKYNIDSTAATAPATTPALSSPESQVETATSTRPVGEGKGKKSASPKPNCNNRPSRSRTRRSSLRLERREPSATAARVPRRSQSASPGRPLHRRPFDTESDAGDDDLYSNDGEGHASTRQDYDDDEDDDGYGMESSFKGASTFGSIFTMMVAYLLLV